MPEKIAGVKLHTGLGGENGKVRPLAVSRAKAASRSVPEAPRRTKLWS